MGELNRLSLNHFSGRSTQPPCGSFHVSRDAVVSNSSPAASSSGPPASPIAIFSWPVTTPWRASLASDGGCRAERKPLRRGGQRRRPARPGLAVTGVTVLGSFPNMPKPRSSLNLESGLRSLLGRLTPQGGLINLSLVSLLILSARAKRGANLRASSNRRKVIAHRRRLMDSRPPGNGPGGCWRSGWIPW